MSFTKSFFAALLFVAAFSLSVSAQAFIKAERNASADGEIVNFKFSTDGTAYQVTGKTGRISGGKRAFILPLEKGAGADHVKVLKLQNDLIVLFEQDFGGEGSGTIARINTATGKAKWTRRVPAFNLMATAETGFAYVAGVGYMGKINLADGSVVWKSPNIYSDRYGKIDVPAAPEVTATTVVMTQDTSSGSGNGPARIVFNKKTGAIIR